MWEKLKIYRVHFNVFARIITLEKILKPPQKVIA